jgi:3-isopropylmalate/(R)-2-methylmalate dehydratase small subunit
VLVAGRNFGCGSSREHAPWALEDAGFQAIIAPSFADIFRTNCGKIGVVCVQLDETVVRQLFDLIAADPASRSPSTSRRSASAPRPRATCEGVDVGFDIDQHTKHCLLNGLDDIGLTLQHEDAIAAYEADRPVWKPDRQPDTALSADGPRRPGSPSEG